MKDGRTHLAHKAEHAVDLETGAIVGVTVQGADQGDTTTIAETVTAAAAGTRGGGGRDGRTDGGDRRGGGRQGVSQQSGAGGSGGRSICGRTSPSRIAGGATGRRRRWPGMRCMPIAGASAARVGWLCSGGGANISNGRTHISTKPAACGGRMCAGMRTSSNACSSKQAPSNLGLLMRTLIGVGTPRGLQGAPGGGLGTRRLLVDTRCRPLASRSHTIRRSRARGHTASSFRTNFQSARQNGPFNHGLLGCSTLSP